MASRASLLGKAQTIATVDWAARVDTPERNELALANEGADFGISFLMVDKTEREVIPRSLEGRLREQFPVWFGDGARMLGFEGKKIPDFTGKAKKSEVRGIMVQGKFRGARIPEVNSAQPSYGMRIWAPENAEQIVEKIKSVAGTELAVQLESALDRALRAATKAWVAEQQTALGLDLIAAAWLQNEMGPQYLYADIYVSSVGIDNQGRMRTVEREKFYAAVSASNSVARSAFYTSLNASLVRLGQPKLYVEPERAGIEGLASVVARQGMPSPWFGGGAAALGLVGEASLEDIKTAIVDGTWQGLKLRTERTERVAYSIVHNVSKTASMLLASTDVYRREAVEAAMIASWETYVATIEMMVTTRRGKNGDISGGLKNGGLLGAYWLHRTSSTGDPNLHIHGIMASSALGSDGKWRTIRSKVFFAAKPIAEAAAMRTFYEVLSEKLDLRPQDWTWTLVGSVMVPEITTLMRASREFSGATRHIEQVIKEGEKSGVLEGRQWRDHLRAYRDHRADKNLLAEKLEHELDEALITGDTRAEKLRSLWRQRASAIRDYETGKSTPVDIDKIRFGRRSYQSQTAELSEHRLIEILTDMHSWRLTDVAALLLTDVDGRERLVEAARVVRDLWDRGLIHTPEHMSETGESAEMPPPSADDVRAMWESIDQGTARTVEVERIISISAVKMVTEEALRRERAIQQAASRLSKTQRIVFPAVDVQLLDNQQIAAVAEIAKGRALAVITGVAGSGKTTLLKPIVDAARAQKLNTIVVSRNALRAQETQDGIGADGWVTAARLYQIDDTRQTLVLVDEGALLDTRDWLALLELAGQPEIQIIAIGDRWQNQPIDRRAAWASVIAGIEGGGGSVTRLEKSYRCRAWEDEASSLRDGDTVAIEKAKADGRIIPVAGDIATAVAKIWEPGQVVVTATNEMASSVSTALQLKRRVNATTPISHDTFCGVGDIVRTRQNTWDKDKTKIYNGDTWTVVKATPGRKLPVGSTTGHIVLERAGKPRGRRSLPTVITATVSESYYRQYVELAYAKTVDTAQGVDGDQAIVVAEPDLMSGPQLYTGATRSKAAPIYIVPVESQILSERAAVQILKDILSRDEVAKTAHEIVARKATLAKDLKARRPEIEPEAEIDAGKIAEADAVLEKIKSRRKKRIQVKPEPEVHEAPDVFVDLTSPIDLRRPGSGSPDFGL